MLHKDKRGRVRFTVDHVRYEINKHGVLRTYRRGLVHQNSERAASPVNVKQLDRAGRNKLWAAIHSARYA